MPSALITGVQGQDGSYLAEALLADGWEVHGLVRDEDAAESIDARVLTHRGDLRDQRRLGSLVAEVAPHYIFNLGGLSSVAQSWKEPAVTGLVTARAPVLLMEAAMRLQDDSGRAVRFVQASSAEIFGEPATSPQNENTPIAPISPYGAAKAFAHKACAEFRERGLHASSVVLYNHESPRRPRTFVTRKITTGVAAIVRGEATELTLGNLQARRDWGWAPDYVDALRRVAGYEQPTDFVIGTGEAHSVREFVAAAFSAAGIDDYQRFVRVDNQFARPTDATELRADATRARDLLGWEPTVGFAGVVAKMVHADLT